LRELLTEWKEIDDYDDENKKSGYEPMKKKEKGGIERRRGVFCSNQLVNCD
jgi:hypothetical protein